MRTKKFVMGLALLLVFVSLVYAQIQGQVNVFCDDVALTVDKSFIDWGTLEPNQKGTEQIKIFNNGDHPLKLFFLSQNWDSLNAKNYLKFSTDYSNESLEAGEQRNIDFFLDVAPETKDVSSFSFDIVIESEITYQTLIYNSIDAEKGPHFLCQVCGLDFYDASFQVYFNYALTNGDFNDLVSFICPKCGAKTELYLALHYEKGTMQICVQRANHEGKGGINKEWYVIDPLLLSP